MIDQMEAFVLEARIKVIVAPRQWGKTTILRLEANYAPDEKTLFISPTNIQARAVRQELKYRDNLAVTSSQRLRHYVGTQYDLILVDNFEYCYLSVSTLFQYLPKRIVLTSNIELPPLKERAKVDPDYLYLSYL